MYSLVVLFSNDRLQQLNCMYDCWAAMAEDFDTCEKLLCVDGPLAERPKGNWTILEVARRGSFFCWADVINAGVWSAKHDIVFYYDSDRIIPTGHTRFCLQVLWAQDVYVYSEHLYGMNQDVWDLKRLQEMSEEPWRFVPAELYPDFRVSDPLIYEHKNPFAGGVAFRRDTFLRHGGFDARFVGYGYPDFDFFLNTTRQGARFVQSPYAELHLKHPYKQGQETVAFHNAWNCWQYVKKWSLDRTYVDAFWTRLQIPMEARRAGNLGEFLSCF